MSHSSICSVGLGQESTRNPTEIASLRAHLLPTMSAAANGRIMKELKEVGKNDTSGVQAKVINEADIRHLRGSIQGPEGTPYEGGVFEIEITIPKQYPFEPPKMKFMTKIWHPNISSQTGAICLVGSHVYMSFDHNRVRE